MTRTTTLTIAAPEMLFSAGHFTIFSATEREPLHGHNFTVTTEITAAVDHNGMTCDYRLYKKKYIALCKQLNNTFLLAENSPHAPIVDADNQVVVHFHEDRIPFLKKDVLILPVANISVEELSRWFTEQIILDKETLEKYQVSRIVTHVSTKPGQQANFVWDHT